MGEDASSNQLDDLWDQIDAAVAEEDAFVKKSAIEELARRAESLAHETGSADAFYSLGYVLYFHPERTESGALHARVDRALLDAIKVDPHHARAWLYLGHNAYDVGEFALAKRRFQRIADGALPPYLDLKAKEMDVCCAIKTEGLRAAVLEFRRFVKIAEAHPSEDIWPKELASCFREGLTGCDQASLPQLRELAKRLDAVGNFGPWFQQIFEASE